MENIHPAHIRTAVALLEKYDGSQPFGHYVKSYFSANKKHGSRDRRNILHLCYTFFRTSGLFPGESIEERLLQGSRLRIAGSGLEEAAERLPQAALFPLHTHLSNGIDPNSFGASHLYQPDLFIRIRPGHERQVLKILDENKIPYKKEGEHALRLPNGVSLEGLLKQEKQYVVQDLSSQRVAEFFPEMDKGPVWKVWDVCAASGGKSILLWDHTHHVELTVTDIRKNILHNLRERFREAGITSVSPDHMRLLDASKPIREDLPGPYDLLILDVPCSGSGTWGRTPEYLVYFQEKEIARYSQLQKDIVHHTLPFLKPGGYLLYITCSVFREENEENVRHFAQAYSLTIEQMEVLRGYEEKADTMFVCLMKSFTSSPE